jgi:hypothetical protein
VVAVSYNEDPTPIRPFLEKGDYRFDVLLDDRENGATGPLYQVGGIPTLFLIDPQGTVRWKKIGFSPGDELGIRRRVESLVSGA